MKDRLAGGAPASDQLPGVERGARVRDRKAKAEFIFVGVLALAFGAALVYGLRWPMEAGVFPVVVGVAGLVLAIVQLGTCFRGDRQEEVRGQEEPSARVGHASSSGMASFGWVLAMFAATVVAGFLWGLPFGILLYYKFEGKQRLAVALVLAAVGWGAIYAWTELLHLPLFKGLIWTYLPI